MSQMQHVEYPLKRSLGSSIFNPTFFALFNTAVEFPERSFRNSRLEVFWRAAFLKYISLNYDCHNKLFLKSWRL